MEHYTEKQYDDDLTIVADEYDDSFHTDNVDLFEFPTYDESPLARLKSLVLSIDWEITDDVLHQFNDELVDLKDVWADEKIYLVYIQALEKISKYIYKEKADANPNAIKLLLSFYYNLEKMVSSDSMTEGEKRQLLLEDVRKFEILKKQISKGEKKATSTAHGEVYADEMQPSPVTAPDPGSILFDLKALVLGIDWEITEIELERLRDEVHRLEDIFAGSRPKQIFLQGLGTLAAYIRLKKSDAHADVFKLLHSFVAGLEKIVTVPMSLEEEKRILLPEVEKFNEFKAIVGAKIKPSKVEEEEITEDEEEGGSIAPALSSLPEGEERGFQEEEEAAALDLSSTSIVEGQVDRFFTDSDERQFEEKADQSEVQAGRDMPDEGGEVVESHLDAMFQTDAPPAGPEIDREESMRGADVESDADGESDQDRLPYQDDDLAPALSDLDESVRIERSEVVPEENIDFAADVESRLDDFFGALDVNEEKPQAAVLETEPEETVETEMQESVAFSAVEIDTGSSSGITLPGVDVESEDDDSGEEPLAFAGADLAPALSGEPEAELMATGEDRFAVFEPADRVSVEEERIAGEIDSAVDIEDRLDSFFGKEEEPAREGQTMNVSEEPALTEESIEESPSDRKEVKYEDVEKIEQPSSSMFVMEVLEEGEIEEELAFEPVEEEKGAVIGEASLDTDDEPVFEGLEEPAAADVFEVSSMEEGFQLESVPESLESGQLMAAVPDIEALSEEQSTGEEELPIAAMEDPLSNLRACVGSLGLELEDSIFEGMHADIDSLRNEYAAVPLARMFLQLISTATQHIETYRYEASAEAFSILQSLTDALGEALEDPRGFSAQEMLLSEMTTVLLWQKDMLDRQAVAKGGRLTFAVPVRTTAGEIFEEEEISFEAEEVEERDSAAIEPAVEEEPAGGVETGSDLFTTAETVALDSEDIFAAEDLVVADVPEVQDQHIIVSMDDDSYTALADDLAGERLAVTGAEDPDERLARQIRELIRSEVELIRQEMQSGMESLRKELLDKEN